MTRAAIYTRFSSHMQREASIEDQERLCRERAEREGWEVAALFADRALSGASMLRPGLQALLEAASDGSVDVVLAEALDRLSRDQADIAALFKRLSFAGVRIVTLAEGGITELHVGLKGTMNQLFLKDLADKTRRGLRGRVEAGRSGGGNSYGYDVVRRLGDDGNLVTGERAIAPAQAAVVRRIFEEFAGGLSPKAIARRLNDGKIPGPRGLLWRDTAIRGHRARGTGILNNELYVGRLIWNRLRYVKDPASGRRVSRPNPEAEWIVTDVPELRIVDDGLWERVKTRQRDLDATPAVKAIRASRFWERRRARHMLTGLVTCGCCGGAFAAVGRDYLACSDARKLGTCDQRKSVRRAVLEEFVLDLIRDRMMRPEAVRTFIAEYHREINSGRDEAAIHRDRSRKALEKADRRLEGLYDAIADGLRTPGILAKIESLENEKRFAEAALAAPAPSPVRLHPNLADLYRDRVAELGAALADPDIRDEAIEVLRGLIESVVVTHGDDGWQVDLQGGIAALVALGMSKDKTPRPLSGSEALCSVKVVAGTGFEPVTFRL